jgi:lipoprotein signal peptidase
MIVFSSIYKVPDNIVDAAIVFGTLTFLNGLFLEGRNKKDKEQSL